MTEDEQYGDGKQLTAASVARALGRCNSWMLHELDRMAKKNPGGCKAVPTLVEAWANFVFQHGSRSFSQSVVRKLKKLGWEIDSGATPCGYCNGTGNRPGWNGTGTYPCRSCNSTGKIPGFTINARMRRETTVL